MKKTKRLFVLTTLIFFIMFFAASASSLFAQSAKGEQAQEMALNTSAQAKTEAQAKEELDKKKEAEIKAQFELMVKTYSLKYISALEFVRAAKFYVFDSTGSENALTVKIYKKDIPAFEDLLKKLDVEKRNIQFQVYTIIASKDQPPERFKNNFVSETQGIADKDLKRVLDEMKGLWNFKYYWVDSPSFLVVKDGAAGSMFKLVSSYDFDMNILRVQLRGDEPGKRIISVGQIKLIQTINLQLKSALIDTSDVTFKEKGYLVVGVTGMIGSGEALILVISAEIK